MAWASLNSLMSKANTQLKQWQRLAFPCCRWHKHEHPLYTVRTPLQPRNAPLNAKRLFECGTCRNDLTCLPWGVGGVGGVWPLARAVISTKAELWQ